MRRRVWIPAGIALCALGMSACTAQSLPRPPGTSQSSSAVSLQPVTATSSTEAVVGENEQTPSGHESLEVPAQQRVSIVHRATSDNTIVFSASGSAQGIPVLLEFFDYDCEFCRQHALVERAWIDAEYVATGRMAIERVFVPMHKLGERLAEAALCSAGQGKFAAMDEFLITDMPKSEEAVLNRLKRLGIGAKEFTKCMKQNVLEGSYERVSQQFGIARVPAFRINQRTWIGIESQKSLKKILSEELR